MAIAVLAGTRGIPGSVPVDPDDPLVDGSWSGAVVDSGLDGAERLAKTALDRGLQVLLTGTPSSWSGPLSEGVTLSRPFRFDPTISRARGVTRTGKIGQPRTLELLWSLDGDDAVLAATEILDIACFLLDDVPATVYALASDVAGPPLIKINLLTRNGAIASIEAAGKTDALPARRELHLLGTIGDLTSRIGNGNFLWREHGAHLLPDAPDRGKLALLELEEWHNGRDDNLARGSAAGWSLALGRSLRRSLQSGEPEVAE